MGNFYEDVIRKDRQFESPTCVHNIMLLEPTTREAILAIIADAAEMGIPLIVWETYRSPARQRALFYAGATQLQHVGVHHFGLAADLVLDVHGEPSWKGSFDFLGELARKHGMVWGGNWNQPGSTHTFIDSVHVQRVSLEDQPRLFNQSWYPENSYVVRMA